MMKTASSQIFPCVKSGAQMADLGAIVAQLKAERAKLDRAIEALSGVAGKSSGGTRKLSAAARARIAAAQRARWAKFKAKKKG
jgi:peptidoglycan hydrolase CwlO-like protein